MRPFTDRMVVVAPELRPAQGRALATTSTGIMIGCAHVRVSSNPGSISGPHRPQRRLWIFGRRLT